METDLKILREIPKTEIHLHLEGLASQETLWHLIQKRNINIGINSQRELQERFQIQNLSEFVDLFVNVIQNCLQRAEDLDYLMTDTRNYLRANNVRYAEIFYSPTKLMQNGIPYQDIIARLTAGARRIEREIGSVVRYLTDVSRSFGPRNATQNLKYHMKYASEAFIGIGIGGSEKLYHIYEFRPIFKKAIEQQYAVVAHAGEDSGPETIWDAIRQLGARRIGHGTSAIQDQKLIEYLRKTQTVLEICPTSNLYTGTYAHSLETHPIRYFFDQGLYVTVNSDDPTPFSTSINDEYCKLREANLFTLQELVQIIKNGIYGTFLSKKSKDALWHDAKIYLMAQKNKTQASD